MPSPTAAPTVAVVITFYRNPAHVRKAVASVVRQTHPPNDVVLGDGAVPDGAEVLEELDPPVRILRHERNRGTGAARQMGLRATTAVVLAGLLGCHLEQAPRPAPPPRQQPSGGAC